jgi:hypothetical protein
MMNYTVTAGSTIHNDFTPTHPALARFGVVRLRTFAYVHPVTIDGLDFLKIHETDIEVYVNGECIETLFGIRGLVVDEISYIRQALPVLARFASVASL